MSWFREEMKVIPRAAWVIAVCLVLAFEALLVNVFMKDFPPAPKVLFGIGTPLIIFVYTLLIGYVAGDARRRGMRPVMWTLLAIFIPSSIGIILYFILRERLLLECPKCGTRVSSGFHYCPACGIAVQPTCQGCGAAVEAGWSHCVRCGARLKAA